MNTITIYTSESGTRSANVEHSDAASHIAAGGAGATESHLLLNFIGCDEAPGSMDDPDGDIWVLVHQGNNGAADFFMYRQLEPA